MTERTIIRLGPRHREAAIATLAAAFQSDPAVSWIIPNEAERARRLPRMFAWLWDDHQRHGIALGTPGCEAVTLWRLPGKVHHHDPLWPPEIMRLLGIFGRRILRASTVGDAIGAHLAKGEDWYYLRYAGVQPDCQGQGLGGLTIRAGLAEAAAAGKPALLETATESNVGIYLRLGFAVHEEWDVPAKGGPHFWSMSRPV
ncbi:MAG: GNAT family N-acetyltransferase [Novosphingobium sp.]|jgi:GNAT superfamily N-acetyltransferase|nr:GNAT family N-acetyltransferase [Novosphingobium sp.]